MPSFPTEKLRTVREYERAMVILSFIGHAYCGVNRRQLKLIPKVLAQPWYDVAKNVAVHQCFLMLLMPLNNWRRNLILNYP